MGLREAVHEAADLTGSSINRFPHEIPPPQRAAPAWATELGNEGQRESPGAQLQQTGDSATRSLGMEPNGLPPQQDVGGEAYMMEPQLAGSEHAEQPNLNYGVR